MTRSYQDAVAALNTLQTNFSTIQAIKKSGGRKNQDAIPEMLEWVRRSGFTPVELNRLRPIHIAGTKGKGSTSAFISWILAQYISSATPSQPSLHKIGLYTSPHLRYVRERIQINNEPISEEVFAKYFFELWDKLEDSARIAGEPTGLTAKPTYFRYLTLMAFHTFLKEGVDTAIIECGIGGEFDSTNILVGPTCTGITSLGIDHVDMLGNTIEQIAWHKAGIMKPGAPAFTIVQPPTAQKVLQERADAVPTPLKVVLQNPTLEKVQLGLAGDFQKLNASLAIAITESHLTSLGISRLPTASELPEQFVRGLESTRLGGRCEVRHDGDIVWHLDCGHTLESIEVAAKWFATQTLSKNAPDQDPPVRVLVFNQQKRDANALVRRLHSHLASAMAEKHPFTHAVFCTNVTFSETGYRPDVQAVNVNTHAIDSLDVQRALAETWKQIDPQTDVKVEKSIEAAITQCRAVANGADRPVQILVTGSVHLVGGVLEVLSS